MVSFHRKHRRQSLLFIYLPFILFSPHFCVGSGTGGGGVSSGCQAYVKSISTVTWCKQHFLSVILAIKFSVGVFVSELEPYFLKRQF